MDKSDASSTLRFGDYHLDVANERLTRRGEPVLLTPKTFALLACLAQRPGQLVTKDELLDIVWGRRHISEGVVKTVVSELRAALADDARHPRWIETVARRGYRFIGSDAPAPASAPPPSEPAAPGLIGRDGELAQLGAAWDRARTGQRQLVLVAGEAGVGKSALLSEFLAGLAHGRVACGQCVEAYGADEAYLPVLEALGQLCATAPALVDTVRRCAPTWLVQMPWYVTDADRSLLQREVAGATQDRMLREMDVLLDHLAREMPMLLVLEDLHWSDASTLRLVNALTRRRTPTALMIVCSYRPADVAISEHPFDDLRREIRLQPACREIVLEGLDESSLVQWLGRRFGGAAFDPAFIRALHRHTEGLPLFVLGVLDELVEAGVIAQRDDGEGWHLAEDAGVGLPVPQNLGGVIEKQFMRLPPDTRALLETAALAAPEFQHIELAEAMALPEGPVRETLEDLVRRQIWLRGTGARELPDGRWATHCMFGHALIRHTLARRVGATLRVTRHRRLADSLERCWGVRAGEIAGELFMHAEQGHEPLRAARQAAMAARTALQRRAEPEALAMTQRGLALAETLPTTDRREVEIELLALRITAMLLNDGLTSPAAQPLVAQAMSMVRDLPVTPTTVALWHVAMLVHQTGRLPGTTDLARRFLEGARAGGDAHCLAAAHNAVAIDRFSAGKVPPAIVELEQALVHATDVAAESTGALLRHPRMVALSYLGLAQTLAGRFAQARAHHAAVDDLIEQGTDLISECLGRWFQVQAHFYRRDAVAMRDIGERCVTLLESLHAMPALQPHRMALGWARVVQGDRAGAALARRGLEQYRAQGGRQGLACLNALVGDALYRAEDVDGAAQCVADGLAWAEKPGERFGMSELLRLQAELALAADPASTLAESLARQAVALAIDQGALLFEALAWVPLARVWQAQGRLDEARAGIQDLLARAGPPDEAPALMIWQHWLVDPQAQGV